MKILSASLLCVLLTAQTVLAQVSASASAPAAKPQDPTIPAIKYDKDGVTPHVGFMKNHKKSSSTPSRARSTSFSSATPSPPAGRANGKEA